MGSKNTHYDVIVVGGGLAGLALSTSLARMGFSVACIDKSEPDFKPSGDMRTTAISYGSHKILKDAGIWQRLKGKTCAIKNIEIYDGASPLLLGFLEADIRENAYGWVVDNADLRKVMSDALADEKTASHFAPCDIDDIKIDDDAVYVSTNKGDFSASLIVGADGRGSYVRESCGIQTRHKNYNQTAIICTVAHEYAHNGTAVEHFHDQGPFAILPRQSIGDDKQCSAVIITVDGDSDLMGLSDSDFEILLRARFPQMYGHVRLISQRIAYPLSLSYAHEYVLPRVALVGDSAHGIHPIAGQGLNLGLRDVAFLTEILTMARDHNDDIGSLDILKQYQQQRRPDVMAMIGFTDAINTVFSNKSKTMAAIRKTGLRAMRRLPRIKSYLIKKTMGDP